MKVLVQATKQERKDKLYQMYLVEIPYMKDAISFDDYCLKYEPVELSNKSKDEIMKELLHGTV